MIIPTATVPPDIAAPRALPVNNPQPTEFDFEPRTRMIFGAGSLGRLGELARHLGGRRVLLVTDPGVARAGHAQRAISSLEAAGMVVVPFDQVAENPTSDVVDQCKATAAEAEIDFIVGIGGGSSMDTAKGCNFLLTNGGTMEDYWGVGKAARPMLSSIAIPTTTGTGSECQSFALISHPKTRVKMACGDSKAAALVAVLDPELVISQPKRVAISTGIDALAHTVETAVSRRRNPVSAMFSREAFRLCSHGFPRLLADPDDLDSWGEMQLGAAWAGTAIENSMLGAAHGAANPLTKRFGLVHGVAVGLMLPTVIRFNGADPGAASIYRDLLWHAGLAQCAADGPSPSETLATELEHCFRNAGLESELNTLRVAKTELEPLADEAAQQWTAGFNPRTVTAREFQQLYWQALSRHDRIE